MYCQVNEAEASVYTSGWTSSVSMVAQLLTHHPLYLQIQFFCELHPQALPASSPPHTNTRVARVGSGVRPWLEVMEA